MRKNYLVASSDEPINHWIPKVVIANSEPEALHTYLRRVYAKDTEFRDTVLDLSINMGFLSKFVLSNDGELMAFFEQDKILADTATVQQRIREFFAEQPGFAERFLQYMHTSDPTLIDDDMYEFIATSDPDGLVAIELESIETIAT